MDTTREQTTSIQFKKRSGRRKLLVLILISSFSLFALVSLQVPDGLLGVLVNAQFKGRMAPDFTLNVWSGPSSRNVRLSSLKGNIVVLNFWASWCEACRIEAPDLESTWQKYRSQGVVFIGIAFEDDKKSAMDFLRYYHVTYINGPDTTETISKAYLITNVGVPETVVVKRDGTIARKLLGAIDSKTLSQTIQAAST